MRDLVKFLENQINKKVNIFEYKNQELKSNQELITFNDTLYVIEMQNQDIQLDLNGYFYLIYQPNLDFNTLKNVLNNLYEDIKIINYKNNLLINSKSILNISNDTAEIIESETYSNTYIFNINKINDIEILNLKINLFLKLLPIILKNSNTNKYISTKDLILYRNMYISSKDKTLCNLIDFEKIKIIDDNLLFTGISFIENGLNISKTSSSLFLHRNTLIYRLEKIKELLNLDLKNFKDAMIFYISINSYFLFKNL